VTRRTVLGATIAALAFPVVLFATLCLGGSPLSPRDVALALLGRFLPGLGADPVAVSIVWELRLARSLLAATSGAALAASGAVLQGLFRNPLADPYSLGVSSGASLGAVLAISFGLASPFSAAAAGRVGASAGAAIGAVELLAFAGAIVSAFLVYGIARRARAAGPTAALLLAGTAVGALVSAVVSLIVSLRDRDLHEVFFWLLGGFGGKGWVDLAAALPAAAASIIMAALLARPLDLLGAGEEAAGSLGLDVAMTRRLAVAASSLGAAAAVSAGGIIGFVGLLGPHIARLLVGPGHRRLVPASAAIGAALLAGADALARSVASPLELPVGVVTAIIGAPLFLRLLARPIRSEASA
jgi:iron complex transport system permease protein